MIIEIDGKRFSQSDFKYAIIYLSDSDKKNIMAMPKENYCYGIFDDKIYSVKEAKIIIETFAKETEKEKNNKDPY